MHRILLQGLRHGPSQESKRQVCLLSTSAIAWLLRWLNQPLKTLIHTLSAETKKKMEETLKKMSDETENEADILHSEHEGKKPVDLAERLRGMDLGLTVWFLSCAVKCLFQKSYLIYFTLLFTLFLLQIRTWKRSGTAWQRTRKKSSSSF